MKGSGGQDAGPDTGVAAIGARVDVAGFGRVGVTVHSAETAEEVRSAWVGLPTDVGLVILGADAAESLSPADLAGRLTVVLPR